MINNSVTIIDIAKAANVSTATVSRVLNNTGNVKTKTREAVLSAVHTLGYQENYLAKSLSTSRTQTIGMLFPDIRDPFYSTLFSYCTEEADRRGYSLMICNHMNSSKMEARLISRLLSLRTCGIIYLGGEIEQNQASSGLVKQLKIAAERTPVVTSVDTGIPGCSSIGPNYKECMNLAIRYLNGLGHKNISFIGGRDNDRHVSEELDAYNTYCSTHNMSYCTHIETGNSPEDGYAAMKSLFYENQVPTALILHNDILAIGVARALSEHNKIWGKDISVISLGDTKLAGMFEPALTSVSFCIPKLAKAMVDMIINQHEGLSLPITYPLDYSIVLRESCNPYTK